jgi:hypothetical protein
MIAILHVAWWLSPAISRSEVVTGLGASVIALGVLVTARPFLRVKLAVAVGQAMPPLTGTYAVPSNSDPDRRRERLRPQVRRDVIAERIVGPILIVLGTLLNGYGSPIVRWFGL